mgnify:CR=1 FL=1
MQAWFSGSRLAPFQHSEGKQQRKCANGCDDDRPEVDAADRAETERARNEAADNCTGNTDDDRYDEPARIIPRHDELGDQPRDKSQNYPRQNIHDISRLL